MKTGREILIYLSLKFNGDYFAIRDAIKNRDYDLEGIEEVNVKANTLTMLDEDYPREFLKLPYPPIVLYYYGDISLLKDISKNIAVIGTRKLSSYGFYVTKKIVKEISKDMVVVSGLARGIDSLAQQTAIENNGKTIAVLGSGIENCYPPENEELYQEIKQNHLLISEYPNCTEPTPHNLLFRNRLIAMFSKGVLITEARIRSGTSVTANWALAYQKDVMCVPYQYGCYSLCNYIINEGAHLIDSVDDVYCVMEIEKNKTIFEN